MKLPIGIQTFRKIREEDYIYIDKTKEAYELITNYSYVFLSRPRRFGKSLFVDTLRNIFEGNKKLFKELYIYDKWDFEEHPVIIVNWSGSFKNIKRTEKRAKEILAYNQERLGVKCNFDNTPEGCLEELIHRTYKKYHKKVVVLIDEYDKPILDNIENLKTAKENRDFLRSFYGILKPNDEFLKFVFLTGITKFSRASIFSGLNMLEDISLNSEFGNICGYTQQNIENEFKELLEEVDLKQLKRWYNGYNFLRDEVYNPFDILQFIKNRFKFYNYWWESGNPYYLIELLKKDNYNIPKIENITIGSEILNSFDIEKLRLEVLLYQAGYLTIDKVISNPMFGINEYKLKVPNLEVQTSLNRLFLDYLTDSNASVDINIIQSLLSGDIDKFREIIVSLFASIPYNNFVKNKIEEYEGYYASVVYSFLAGAGFEIVAEDVTNAGRIDLTIKVGDYIYILEFKVTDKECKALKQIKEKRYYEKYLNEDKKIYLIGICFDKETKNISQFKWEGLSS